MIQYIRLKHMKHTGKITLEYLSISEDEIPHILFKSLSFLTTATAGFGDGGRGSGLDGGLRVPPGPRIREGLLGSHGSCTVNLTSCNNTTHHVSPKTTCPFVQVTLSTFQLKLNNIY